MTVEQEKSEVVEKPAAKTAAQDKSPQSKSLSKEEIDWVTREIRF